MPTAKDNHQMKNEYYKELGCCWVLNQNKLNKEKLFEIISKILKKKYYLNDKKLNLEKMNYKNSWNDINQKLIQTINEN